MKASEIPIGFAVEIPNEIASLVFNTEYAKKMFLESYGDVEVYYDAYYQEYKVPEFAESRKMAMQSAISHCDKWGCE